LSWYRLTETNNQRIEQGEVMSRLHQCGAFAAVCCLASSFTLAASPNKEHTPIHPQGKPLVHNDKPAHKPIVVVETIKPVTKPIITPIKPISTPKPLPSASHLKIFPFQASNHYKIYRFPHGSRFDRCQWSPRHGCFIYCDLYGRCFFYSVDCGCYRSLCECPVVDTEIECPSGPPPCPEEVPPPMTPPDGASLVPPCNPSGPVGADEGTETMEPPV
jgi:hypothetical protein